MMYKQFPEDIKVTKLFEYSNKTEKNPLAIPHKSLQYYTSKSDLV